MNTVVRSVEGLMHHEVPCLNTEEQQAMKTQQMKQYSATNQIVILKHNN